GIAAALSGPGRRLAAISGDSMTPSEGTERSRPRLWLGAGVAAAALLVLLWHTYQPAVAAQRGKPPPEGVTVNAAVATRSDVPVTVEGLGTVQAFYTASLAAQVTGKLQEVFFTEGQLVKKGQLLAQIDPRPLQAALDQALAVQAKDSAQLESAKLDL